MRSALPPKEGPTLRAQAHGEFSYALFVAGYVYHLLALNRGAARSQPRNT